MTREQTTVYARVCKQCYEVGLPKPIVLEQQPDNTADVTVLTAELDQMIREKIEITKQETIKIRTEMTSLYKRLTQCEETLKDLTGLHYEVKVQLVQSHK